MANAKPLSPHVGFYKSFGRPFAKVFLMGFCSYQIFYYTWIHLESNEMKQIKQKELDGLVKRLQDMDAVKKS
ncbi:MAG: hypothetical protein GOMPHAMPRED_000923 [Gomphillus americanus]|uniref:Uncharacterized protein n=1 Tax=Gomphillus americanus TaxID=1940652 RepID=A0A8H3IHU7_9LECA|nr:MAG: hypothetical protein GOMPHAMPRED_000923 [Gomphillus americanus]